MTMNDLFGALGAIIALAGILFTIWQFLGPKLALSFSSKGTRTTFGTEDGYTWHLEVRNLGKLRPANNVRAVVKKISHGPVNGSLKIKWTHPMQIKWSYDGDRTSPRTLRRGGCEIANIGFIVRKNGYFQLDVCQDPWPPIFPGLLNANEQMCIEVIAEADNARSKPFWIKAICYGGWSENADEMAEHIVIEQATSCG